MADKPRIVKLCKCGGRCPTAVICSKFVVVKDDDGGQVLLTRKQVEALAKEIESS